MFYSAKYVGGPRDGELMVLSGNMSVLKTSRLTDANYNDFDSPKARGPLGVKMGSYERGKQIFREFDDDMNVYIVHEYNWRGWDADGVDATSAGGSQ